jgi:hypothetical protein
MGAKVSRKRDENLFGIRVKNPLQKSPVFVFTTEEINRFERTGFQPLRAVPAPSKTLWRTNDNESDPYNSGRDGAWNRDRR